MMDAIILAVLPWVSIYERACSLQHMLEYEVNTFGTNRIGETCSFDSFRVFDYNVGCCETLILRLGRLRFINNARSHIRDSSR